MSSREYVVQKNDTLWDIAAREYGNPKEWPAISIANELKIPSYIFVGQRLKIPLRGAPGHAPLPENFEQVSMLQKFARAIEMNFPEIAVDLDLVDPIKQTIITPTGGVIVLTLKFKGTLYFKKKGSISNVTIKNFSEFEAKMKDQTRGVASDLIRDAKMKLSLKDLAKPELSFSCGLETVLKPYTGTSFYYKLSVVPGKVSLSLEPTQVAGGFAGFEIKGRYGWELSAEGSMLGPPPAFGYVPSVSLIEKIWPPPPLSEFADKMVYWIPVIGLTILGTVITIVNPGTRLLNTGTMRPYDPNLLREQQI